MEPQSGRLVVSPGTILSFDTYFNSFFESHWRRHTSVERLVLRLTLEGSGVLRVHRRALGRKTLLCERSVSAGPVSIDLPAEAVTFRQFGTLCLELEACGSELVFVAGAWWSDTPAPNRVGLAAVFCTFGREAEITRIIAALAADAAVTARLARVVVVNQGQVGLAAHPAMLAAASRLGCKLEVVEQDNFGGAGGFGRGLLAALDDPAATHAVLLDDDILLEPDSLLRMAAFFAHGCHPLVVGGHMLDLVQPHLLYEAGAIVSDRHWEFMPQHHGLALDDAGALERLTRPHAIHYNGWWCCGFSLSIVEEHGMPLPCFIRGDDVEFGLRLHMRGIPSVSFPGVAVWHEPFYLKLDGWQRYYETRNMLVAASLHLAPRRLATVRRLGRQVVMNLLTFRYYTVALILAAIEDFLRGPAGMHADPTACHRKLATVRAAYPLRTSAREVVLERQVLRPPPRSRPGCFRLLARLMVRNCVAPTSDAPARLLDGADLGWLAMRGVEHVAVESWWSEELVLLHRSRDHHRSLLRQAVSVLVRLYAGLPRVAAAWRADAPVLTSQTFWRSYLGLSSRPGVTAGRKAHSALSDPP